MVFKCHLTLMRFILKKRIRMVKEDGECLEKSLGEGVEERKTKKYWSKILLKQKCHAVFPSQNKEDVLVNK